MTSVHTSFTAKRLSKFLSSATNYALYIPPRWLYQLHPLTRLRNTLKIKANVSLTQVRMQNHRGEDRVSQRAQLSKYPYIVEACATRVPVHYATTRILTPLDIHNMVTRVSANIRIGGCPCHRRYSYYLNTIYHVSRYTHTHTHIGLANESLS